MDSSSNSSADEALLSADIQRHNHTQVAPFLADPASRQQKYADAIFIVCLFAIFLLVLWPDSAQQLGLLFCFTSGATIDFGWVCSDPSAPAGPRVFGREPE